MSGLADRLRAAFAGSGEHPVIHVDSRAAQMAPADFTDAAVLVPIIDAPEPRLLMTVRHADLRTHAGQIAFPGGRTDKEDANPTATALREAEEEVGLPRDVPDVVGAAVPYHTGTGYRITPVVAVIPDGLLLVPHEAEVAAIFEPPLAHVLDSVNQRRSHMMFGDTEREIYEILWRDYRIWGVTAGLIVNLSQRLRAFA